MRQGLAHVILTAPMCFIRVMPVRQFAMIAVLYNGDAE